MCEWFDETCGDLLKIIDENGDRENTFNVYVTDNGWIKIQTVEAVTQDLSRPL